MSWRDELQPGSFRGVPFKIMSDRSEIGRRVQLHEYPLRDESWAEDLGLAADRFAVECIVIGADYMKARDALIKALKTKGVGTLVHPYYGVRRVKVIGRVQIAQSTQEGGLARFRIPFVQAGKNLQPTVRIDTAAAVATQASVTTDTAQQSFADTFSVDGLPQWASDLATSDLGAFTDRLQSLRDGLPGVPASVTDFDTQLGDFSDALSSLIRQPFNLGSSVVSLVLGLGTLAAQPVQAIALYKDLLDFGSSDASVATTTPARTQQAANRSALNQLVRTAAVAGAAKSSALTPAQTEPVADTVLAVDPDAVATQGYDTTESASQTRDTISDAIDQLELDADDQLYPQLIDLRAAVVRDLDTRAAQLPGLTTFTPGITLPALVVAYRIYGDAERDAQIVAMNDPMYPGFLTGGEPLEVLSE